MCRPSYASGERPDVLALWQRVGVPSSVDGISRRNSSCTISCTARVNLYRFGDFAVRVDVVADWVADYQLTRRIRYSVVPQPITDMGQRR